MKIFFLIILLFLTTINQLHAQDADSAKNVSKWAKSWVASLNGSQAEYSNWSQGGVSSIAATASTVFDAKFTGDHFRYTSFINLKYGQTRIQGDNIQKTDDLIRVTNKIDKLILLDLVSAFIEVDFKTQFDDGFNDTDVLISKFFAPAFFQESAGISYSKKKWNAQLGLALKQTVVSDTTLTQFYGVDPGEQFRGEGGLSFVANYKSGLAENVDYTGRIETFTNFLTPLSFTDFTFSNELNGKINSTLSTNIQFVMMYDRDFNTQIQIKQVIAVGISVKIL